MGDIAKISDLDKIFENLVRNVFAFAGIVLFVVLMMAGISYITAGGNPEKMQGAQKTITFAIGGLIVLLFAYFILYVIGELTGAEITNFTVVGTQ